MDEPVAESSTGNSIEAPRTGRRAAIEASIKKSWDPSHLKVLSNATQKHSEAEKRNLTNSRQ